MGIVATVLLTYAGTFRVPLLFDDVSAITENPSIRDLWSLPQVLTVPADTLTAGRPLVNFSFAVSYALSKGEPWGYHVLNLALHVFASLTLFGVIRRTLVTPVLKPRWGESSQTVAGTIALLWGIHPIQTQTVTYVSQRAESLMALFYLLTLYCFIRGVGRREGLWHPLAVGACLLGAMCKEVIVTAPIIVLLYDRTFIEGNFRSALGRRKLFYSALASTWLVIACLLADVRHRGVGFGAGMSAFHYALTQCRAITLYLGLSLWPHPLIFDRGTAVIDSVGDALPFALILAGLIAAAVWAWARNPVSGFAPAWFFILLAPASSIVPVTGATIAENRVYLPLAAVITLAVVAVYRSFSSRVAHVVGAGVALAAIFVTVGRNRDFQSEVGLWTDTVRKIPENPRAHYNLAVLLAVAPNRQQEALVHYEAALRLSPDYAEAHNNYAALLATLPNRQQEALAHYEAALRLKPEIAEAHYNLANLFSAMPGRQQDAVTHYEAALRLKPNVANTHNNFAVLLATLPNHQQEALEHYEAALRVKPDYAEAHNNMANLLATIPNRQQDALRHFDAAIRLRPDYAPAYNNLAVLLAAMPNRWQEAVDSYQAAVRLNPDFGEAHYNLANLLAAVPHRQAEAAEHFEAATHLLPFNATVHFDFARLLERFEGRRNEALSHYSTALRLDPNFSAAQEAIERLRDSSK